MQIFRKIFQRLRADGVAVMGQNVYGPTRMPTMEELVRVHDPAYAAAVCGSTLDPALVRAIGLPWSDALVERTLAEVAGVMLTADLALSAGIAVCTAGGTHHAHFNRGGGFCILNDLCVAAQHLLHTRKDSVRRVLICDLDVHQGDGSAAIMKNVPEVFTLSVHCEENFPVCVRSTRGGVGHAICTAFSSLFIFASCASQARKEKSDLDVSLSRGTSDQAYLAAVTEALHFALEVREKS